MNEIEKIAREFLAVEYDRERDILGAGCIRGGVSLGKSVDRAIRAIVAALSEQKQENDNLRRACDGFKEQSLRCARSIKARNKTIRELQGTKP